MAIKRRSDHRIVLGVPLGILAGREVSDLFANQLHVVAQPTIPTLRIALISISGLILANLVAAIPGLQAARTPAALMLHAE